MINKMTKNKCDYCGKKLGSLRQLYNITKTSVQLEFCPNESEDDDESCMYEYIDRALIFYRCEIQ